MKIIQVDAHDRESVAEALVAENIQNEQDAQTMVGALQATCHRGGSTWYRLVEDDHVLWGGMKELV